MACNENYFSTIHVISSITIKFVWLIVYYIINYKIKKENVLLRKYRWWKETYNVVHCLNIIFKYCSDIIIFQIVGIITYMDFKTF